MHLFYCGDIVEGEIFLNEEESFHCMKVLRLQAGAAINLIDGKGTFANAALKNVDSKKCSAAVVEIEKDFKKRNYNLHIAIAPTKKMERFEWFLEKAVELGVDEITPLVCARSNRDKIRMDRLEKIILSAVKQSIQAYIPKLNPIVKFEDVLINSSKDLKLIADCSGDKKQSLQTLISPKKNIFILIGPEGDFTSEEILPAKQNGFISVSLGETTLRTETAGIYICAAMRLINE